MTYIMLALGWILNLFYGIFKNYGFAIIFFTIFVKLVLFPLELKQKKSMAKTQKIQPLLMAIQKKYENDKDRLNKETMKLYQKYGISPASGCLPMFIQLPIIFALFYVVRKPIMYMLGVDPGDIWRIGESINIWASTNMDKLPESLKSVIPVTYEKAMRNNTFGQHEIQMAQLLFDNRDILDNTLISGWNPELKSKLINFDFLGMNLAATPDFNKFLGIFIGKVSNLTKDVYLLWIIPVLSGLTSFISAKITSPNKKQKGEKPDKHLILSEEEKAAQKLPANSGSETMKTMTTIMPFFSAWFAFTLPAAVGLYWITSNIIQMVQHTLVTKYFKIDISLEELEGEIENVRKGRKNRKNRR